MRTLAPSLAVLLAAGCLGPDLLLKITPAASVKGLGLTACQGTPYSSAAPRMTDGTMAMIFPFGSAHFQSIGSGSAPARLRPSAEASSALTL